MKNTLTVDSDFEKFLEIFEDVEIDSDLEIYINREENKFVQSLEDFYKLTLIHGKRYQKIDGCGWEDTRDFAFSNAKKFVDGELKNDVCHTFGLEPNYKFKN
jgi:hypothetical protein